jgi:glycosyltransferase involved in cell wall biosynthesis
MSKPRRKPLISLCMIVKNEAETLARCLKSVRGIADELIVVDTGSTDTTVQIARSFGAEIVSFPWNGDFAAARNAGLEQAKGTWVLILDADEELDAGSKGEMLLCAEHREYEAFFVKIQNHIGLDRSSQVITVNPILRMFRNRPQYRFSGIIHEQIAAVIVEATPAAAMHLSTVVVHHYGYADGVVAKKDKISRNVALLKEQLELNPQDAFHHFNMAVEYMRLGEYGPALEHIKQSLNFVEPDTSYVHLLYKYEIRCRAMLGDTAGALDACSRGIALFPDYPDLAHIKGILLLQTGEYAGARQALRQAFDTGASPPGYHTESGLGTYLTLAALGQLFQETGEDNEAIACYTRAAQLHPEPGPLLARLVRCFKCADREHELIGWLKNHLPQQTAEFTGLPVLLLREGCFAAAAELLGGGVAPDAAAGTSGAGLTDAAAGTGDPVLMDAVGTGGALSSAESAVHAAAAGHPDAALQQLLRKVTSVTAEHLQREDIAALLSHSSASAQPESTAATTDPGLQSSTVWMLLADRMLASLTLSAGYGPAAGRARLAIPLPRVRD